MTCLRCERLPASPKSKYQLCKHCTVEHNAIKARERVAKVHQDQMIAKYGTPNAPKDWRKQARKPTAAQKEGKSASVRPPDKFVGNPKNCVRPVLVDSDDRVAALLKKAQDERVKLPGFERGWTI